jgi:hypothetical protein
MGNIFPFAGGGMSGGAADIGERFDIAYLVLSGTTTAAGGLALARAPRARLCDRHRDPDAERGVRLVQSYFD